MRSPASSKLLASAFLLLFLPACSSLHTRPPDSLAPGHTSEGKDLFSGVPTSQLTLLDRGGDGFLARLALIESATESIDAQYYLWHKEGTGIIYIDRLLAAADRGVKVRLLIDEFLIEQDDRHLAALAGHENIEFRLYNPAAFEEKQKARRLADWLLRFRRLDHRMHNKLFIVDGETIVIGGRNIGDDYFGAEDQVNFRDLGVLVRGPAVAGARATFEEYWFSKWVRPAAFRLKRSPRAGSNEDIFAEINRDAATLNADPNFDLPVALTPVAAHSQLRRFASQAVPARALVIADHPMKEGLFSHESVIGPTILDLEFHADREVLMVNPYFVPFDWEIEDMKQFVDRGGRIRFLTNSMASNNQPTVHSGYAPRRPRVLAAGVELHEVRPDAERRFYHFSTPGAAGATLGLHGKAAVFDDDRCYIGSFNYDPRSANLNTEMGLLVQGATFTSQVKKTLEADLAPENSWRVHALDNGKLRWEGTDPEGNPLIHRHEPATTAWQRLKNRLIGLLPIDSEL